MVAGEGYVVVRIHDVALAPFFVLGGGVVALLADARRLDLQELLALRQCREKAPATAVVMVSTAIRASSDVKRALESGATAFLSWPAPIDVLREALRSGMKEPRWS